jgi:hypothetical protein
MSKIESYDLTFDARTPRNVTAGFSLCSFVNRGIRYKLKLAATKPSLAQMQL